jgi:hypothetical protein
LSRVPGANPPMRRLAEMFRAGSDNPMTLNLDGAAISVSQGSSLIEVASVRSPMGIKTIPLSRLEADPRGTLSECADSGEAFIVELPGTRFVAIQPLEPGDDDSLVSELLETNAAFQELVAKSKASPRKPFTRGSGS